MHLNSPRPIALRILFKKIKSSYCCEVNIKKIIGKNNLQILKE